MLGGKGFTSGKTSVPEPEYYLQAKRVGRRVGGGVRESRVGGRRRGKGGELRCRRDGVGRGGGGGGQRHGTKKQILPIVSGTEMQLRVRVEKVAAWMEWKEFAEEGKGCGKCGEVDGGGRERLGGGGGGEKRGRRGEGGWVEGRYTNYESQSRLGVGTWLYADVTVWKLRDVDQSEWFWFSGDHHHAGSD